MNIRTELDKLGIVAGTRKCPTCGHSNDDDLRNVLRYLTIKELDFLKAWLLLAVQRGPCVYCNPENPCEQHRGPVHTAPEGAQERDR